MARINFNKELDSVDIIEGEYQKGTKLVTCFLSDFEDFSKLNWYARSTLSHILVSYSPDGKYFAITILRFRMFRLKVLPLLPFFGIINLKQQLDKLIGRLWKTYHLSPPLPQNA